MFEEEKSIKLLPGGIKRAALASPGFSWRSSLVVYYCALLVLLLLLPLLLLSLQCSLITMAMAQSLGPPLLPLSHVPKCVHSVCISVAFRSFALIYININSCFQQVLVFAGVSTTRLRTNRPICSKFENERISLTQDVLRTTIYHRPAAPQPGPYLCVE